MKNICIVIATLLVVSCAPYYTPIHSPMPVELIRGLEGVYKKEITIILARDCAGLGGYYKSSDPAEICISTDSFYDWNDVCCHEFNHLFRDVVGLPKIKSHIVK